jgi:hypothetical protein
VTVPGSGRATSACCSRVPTSPSTSASRRIWHWCSDVPSRTRCNPTALRNSSQAARCTGDRHPAVCGADPRCVEVGCDDQRGIVRRPQRVAATRLSFFLSIPALVAAGGYEAATSASDVASGVGWLATGVATVVSFGVAYASIAWLPRFVSGHPITYSSATAWCSQECSSSPCQPVPSPRCDGAPTGVTSVGAQYSWSGYFHASLTAPGSPARSNDAS